MSNADQMRGTGWWLEKERISREWECHKGERNINQQGRDSFFPPSLPCSSRFCLVLTSLEFWHGPIVTKESHPKYFLALMSKINTLPMVWPLFRISFTFIRSWEFVLPFWSYLQLLDPSHLGLLHLRIDKTGETRDTILRFQFQANVYFVGGHNSMLN